MDEELKKSLLALGLTEEEIANGAPTLPLSHVLHTADDMAEFEDEEY